MTMNVATFLGNLWSEITNQVSSDDSGLLGENSGQCERMDGGSEFDSPLRLREIRRMFPEDYASVEEQLQALVGRYVRGVARQNIPAPRRYLSDVILVRSPDDRRRLRRWLSSCGPTYPGGFFIWVDEGDHFHVVHDCPWSNGSCRCQWIKEAVSRI